MGIKTTNDSVDRFMKSIEEQNYTVPQFQRGYVWDTKQAAALIDSIAKGYPFGSITIWETNAVELSAIGELPSCQRTPYKYIVDGQQRLTTLYLIYKNQPSKNKKMDPSKIVVRLGAIEDKIDSIVMAKKELKDGDEWFVYLTDFLTLTRSERRDFYDKRGISADNQDRLEEIRDNFFNCPVPTIEYMNDDLHVSVQVFERINQGGTKLDIFEIVNSITFDNNKKTLLEYESSFNQRAKIQNYAIKNKFWLQGLALSMDLGVGSEAMLKLRSHHLDYIEEYNDACMKAIMFLKNEFGALDSTILPYNHHFVLLAYYYFKRSEKHVEYTNETEMLLKMLDWTCKSNAFDKSTNNMLHELVGKVNEILEGKHVTFPDAKVYATTFTQLPKFTKTSMITKYLISLMMRRDATSWKKTEKRNWETYRWL